MLRKKQTFVICETDWGQLMSCEEPSALRKWNINIFEIIYTRVSLYSHNTYLLPPTPKYSFRHIKQDIQDFHMTYVLVTADKNSK